MAKLAELVKERYSGSRETPGLAAFQMRNFFQRLIANGELRAFSVEVNKRTIVKDDENERVIMIKKGATLEPAEKLEAYRAYIIEDPETGARYTLEITSGGGKIRWQTALEKFAYDQYLLEKLAEDFDLRQVQKYDSPDSVMKPKMILKIPKEAVVGRLKVWYKKTKAIPKNFASTWSVFLSVKGEEDKLFKQICEFVREKAREIERKRERRIRLILGQKP